MKRVLTSKIFLFTLLLAVIWLGLVSVRTWYKKYQLDQEISSLKNEISKFDKQDADLSQLIKYFNNQNFLEKEAKDKLNLKAPDESVVIVPEAAIGQEAPPSSASSTVEQAKASDKTDNVPENNMIKWWKYFFGR